MRGELSDSRVKAYDMTPHTINVDIKLVFISVLYLAMVETVVVAGATGGVGKTIVEQIVKENKFRVVALTRRVRSSYFNPPG